MDSTHYAFRAARLALFLSFAGVSVTAAPVSAQVLDANYETGTEDSGIPALDLGECCDYSHSAATNAKRTGTYSLKSYLKYGDPEIDEGPRAETDTIACPPTRFNHGDSVYYGFSIYILSGLENDGDNDDILYQWKAISDECDDVDGAHMFLTIRGDTFSLRINSDDNECSKVNTLDPDREPLGNLKRGRWNDFVVSVNWDYRDLADGGNGRVRVWLKSNTQSNYVLVLDRLGPNMRRDTIDGFLKWGIYKPSWKTSPTLVSERQFWHDNVRVGSTFNQVDPSLP
jgi:Polysaccharide lyase